MARYDPIPRNAQHLRAPPPMHFHAIGLLRADHRRIRGLLRQCLRSHGGEEQADLALKACHALVIHLLVEEEIFHPAFLDATGDRQLHCQAEVEHDGIKRLVAQIGEAPLQGELFVARMQVLASMVQHHVEEEEKRDGMLAEAACAGLDSEALAQRLKEHRRLLRKRVQLLRWRVRTAHTLSCR